MTPLSCSPPNKRLELFVTKDANRETVSKLESKEIEIISGIYREEIHGEIVSWMTRFDFHFSLDHSPMLIIDANFRNVFSCQLLPQQQRDKQNHLLIHFL